MKKVLALMLMLLMVFSVSCDLLDDDEEDEWETLDATLYMPFAQDYELVFNETENGETTVDTEKFVGRVTKNSNQYWQMVDVDDEDTTLMRNTDNKLVVYFEQFPWEESVPMPTAKIAAGGEVVYADFNLEPGSSWTIYDDKQEVDYSGQTAIMEITFTGAFVDMEDVSVPAGDFTEVAHFMNTMIFKMYIEMPVGDDQVLMNTSMVTDLYFAKDVGLVKTKEKMSSDGQSETTTSELAYWNRPGGGTGGTDPR